MAALQWLRRRGPSLPNGTLQRLFRNRQVRVLDAEDGRVRRVSKDVLLPLGARLLIDKATATAAPALKEHAQGDQDALIPKHYTLKAR